MSQSAPPVPSLRSGRFFLPGPTEVRPEILQAQTEPMAGHRGPEAQALVAELQEGLRMAFRTSRPVFIATCSATGLMEAAVRNAGGGRVLSLVNGAFSKRFADIARSCGLEVDELEVPWGEVLDPERVEAALTAHDYGAVTVVHSETSTGALNDVEGIAEAVRRVGDAVVLVDSVSGAAGARLETDAWGLDFLLTGSQKAFALPPGLAFGVASERMIERARASSGRGYYFDLVRFAENMEKLQVPTTPAISTLYALRVQLRDMREETMEGRWSRHLRLAERTWGWVEEMADRGAGLRVLAPVGGRSPTVTVVMLPEGRRGPDVVAEMKERGYVLGSGYGKLKETSFRVGHMGDHTLEELDAVLAELEDVLS